MTVQTGGAEQDTIERLQARIEELEEVAQRRLEYIDKKNERIEEFEAQVRLRDAQVAFYKELEAITRRHDELIWKEE